MAATAKMRPEDFVIDQHSSLGVEIIADGGMRDRAVPHALSAGQTTLVACERRLVDLSFVRKAPPCRRLTDVASLSHAQHLPRLGPGRLVANRTMKFFLLASGG
jgi:hypothetical protein